MEMKEDFSVWLGFLERFNGDSLWQRDFVPAQELQLFMDAAGSLGFGAFFDGRWCSGPWHPSWVENRVTKIFVLLELFPVVVALVLWGKIFSDRRILLYWNYVILELNIWIKVKHISGTSKTIAVALSCFQFAKFPELVPWADEVGEECPDHL